MTIDKINNSIVFNKGGIKYVFPVNTIMLIANDNSDVINVRLRASRKNVLTFNWNDVTNIQASSANEMLEMISLLSNSGGSSSSGGEVSEEDLAIIDDINNIIG